MKESNIKETVTISLPKNKIEDFRKIKDVLKTYTSGINLTLSGITEEAITKYIEVFNPILNDLKEGKEIDQGYIYNLMSVLFSQISNEFKNLKK